MTLQQTRIAHAKEKNKRNGISHLVTELQGKIGDASSGKKHKRTAAASPRANLLPTPLPIGTQSTTQVTIERKDVAVITPSVGRKGGAGGEAGGGSSGAEGWWEEEEVNMGVDIVLSPVDTSRRPPKRVGAVGSRTRQSHEQHVSFTEGAEGNPCEETAVPRPTPVSVCSSHISCVLSFTSVCMY